jgi:putative membrane protein
MVSGDMKACIPTALDDSAKKKLDKLKDSKPEDLASKYDSMPVSGHEEAIFLFEHHVKGR